MKMLKCPVCGAVKSAPRRQVACSKRCAAERLRQTRGAAFFQRNGAKGGEAGAAGTLRKSLALWRSRFPEIDPKAARAIYKHGYCAGHVRGKRIGFARGWSEAVGETPRLGRPRKVA